MRLRLACIAAGLDIMPAAMRIISGLSSIILICGLFSDIWRSIGLELIMLRRKLGSFAICCIIDCTIGLLII